MQVAKIDDTDEIRRSGLLRIDNPRDPEKSFACGERFARRFNMVIDPVSCVLLKTKIEGSYRLKALARLRQNHAQVA